MFFVEAVNSVKIQLSEVKNDLKNITDDNKEYGRQQGWKDWATTQNQHLRKSLKNCINRISEIPIAFMRDNEKSPVYAFHIQNPSKTRDFYFVCVLRENILDGKALLCGSSLLADFVITNKKSNYLNALPNPNHQIFIDNPNLIEYTIDGAINNKDENLFLDLDLLCQNYNYLYEGCDNSILEYLIKN